MSAQAISDSIGKFSKIFYELATYDGLVGLLKSEAIKTPGFQQISKSPMGLTFGTGNPSVLSPNTGHITQQRLKDYVAKNGLLEHFTSELVLSYLYQFWEAQTRGELEQHSGQKVTSDVFGDLRLIRHALQHERHKALWQASKIDQVKMFLWVRDARHSSLTGPAFNAIVYAIGLELNSLNSLLGGIKGNMSGIPSFFEKDMHFGLLDLNKERIAKLSKIEWYAKYVLDHSLSNIIDLEIKTLGDLH